MSVNSLFDTSTEAISSLGPTPPADFYSRLSTELFGDQHTDIVSSCPEFMRPPASAIIEEYGAFPEPVVAAMLNIAAASFGSRFRVVTRAGAHLTAQFNMLVGHRSLRHLAWLDVVGSPFVGRVTEMLIQLYRLGRREIERRIEKYTQDWNAAARTKMPSKPLIEQSKLDLARMEAQLAPNVIPDRFTIRTIAELLSRAFDPALLSLSGSSDPIDDLALLKPAERRDLARVLNLSWSGRPIPLDKGAVWGAVSILWTTPEANLFRLKTWREFHAGAMPVPILLLSGTEPTKVVQPLSEREVWHQAIDLFFDHRCMQKEEKVYRLSTEADQHLAKWEERYLATLDAVPPQIGRHVAWLPHLACRIALIRRITRDGNDDVISAEDLRAAVEITESLGAAHLQTLARLQHPVNIRPTDSTDNADKATAMLAKNQRKAASQPPRPKTQL